jgi:hypothetical protein
MSKVVIGSAARMLSPEFTEPQSRHWRALSSNPSITLEMPMRQLSRYAIDYLDDGEPKLIEAPLSTSVWKLTCQDLAKVDAFQRVSAFISAVASHRVLGAGGSGGANAPNHAELRQLLGEVQIARHAVQVLYQDVRALKRVRRYQFRVWLLAATCVAALLAFVTYLLVSWAR